MSDRPTILLVDDDDAFRIVLASELGARGYQVATAPTGREAIRAAKAAPPQVVLLDLRLPDTDGISVLEELRRSCPDSSVIMLTGHGTIDTAIRAVRLGAFDYVAKPCPTDDLEMRVDRALECQKLRDRNVILERGLAPLDPSESFVGASPAFRSAVDLATRVAPRQVTVLITGETGVGKEVIAKLIHAKSPRRERPFVVVECAALQDELLLSELFGHERGAYTGAATAKPGLFEVANGGTIFLDEIGEVNLATQVKLLRVLDTSVFRRVGGTVDIKVDVRVLAATNRDVVALVRKGMFREDLLYRISTIRIEVPPLRERPEDIEVMALHFVALFNRRFGVQRRIGAAAMRLLRRHPWPGNVRELNHAIEAATIVSDGDEIGPEDLPASIRSPVAPAEEDDGAPAALVTLREAERAHIERVLRATRGHRSEAARILGISERNLYRKIRELEDGGDDG